MNFGFGHKSSSRRSRDTLVCALWGYSFENEIRVKAGRTHFDESFTTLSAQLNRVVLSECWDLCGLIPKICVFFGRVVACFIVWPSLF